jgi:hypothetical protein
MHSIIEEAIGGFNNFLKTQRDMEDEATITIALFDDQYELLVENANIKAVADLTEETFVPRGMTALVDAVGKTINTVSSDLYKLSDSKRSGKVMFVILTDGHENASKEFTNAEVKKLITNKEKELDWQFIYLGVGADSFDDAASIGIQQANFVGYSSGASFALDGTRAMTQAVMTYRSTGSYSLNKDEITEDTVGTTARQ